MKVGNLVVAILLFIFAAPPAYAQPPKMLRKCQTCHGKELTGKKKNPSIVGLSYEKLYASLTTDTPKKMKRIANKLTDEQKVELSEYIFGLEAPKEDPKPVIGC